YMDVRNRTQSFSGLAGGNPGNSASLSMTDSSDASGGERAELIWGELVSGTLFARMRVEPIFGRAFWPAEDRTENTNPVVVISHSLWQRRFNANAAIVGKAIYLNGVAFTVVGVAPESFYGSQFTIRQEFWTPLMMSSKFGLSTEWETTRDWRSW